jgi:hypothetical protein
MLAPDDLPEGLAAKFDATKYSFFDLSSGDGGLEDDGLGGIDDYGASDDDLLPAEDEEVEEVEITNDDDEEDLSFAAQFAARLQMRQHGENVQGVSRYTSRPSLDEADAPAAQARQQQDQGFAHRVQQHHTQPPPPQVRLRKICAVSVSVSVLMQVFSVR